MAVNVEKLLVTLEARTGEYQRQMAQAQQTTNRQLAAIENRFARTSASVRSSSSSMAMGVTGALGGIGAALSAAALTEYLNAWTRLTRSVDASSQIFGVALKSAQELTALANDARVDIEAYSKLYIRTSAAIRDYGFEAGTAEKVTSTLAKALKLGGAAASEQASVMLQFSQALQKGKLDGDEFRSVMENAGVVQELLSKRLRVSKGAIVEMAAAGKLQISELVGAMVEGAVQVDRLYRQMPQTIDEAFAVLRNNVIQFIGEADKAAGASQAIANGIVSISQNLDKLAVVIGAILGSAAVRMAAFAAATMAAANPLTLIAAAVGALATAYTVYGDNMAATADGTVSLRTATEALFAELADTDAVNAVSSLFADLSADVISYGQSFLDWAGKAATAIGNVLGLTDKGGFVDRVEERARELQMRKNLAARDPGQGLRAYLNGSLIAPPEKFPGPMASGTDKRSQFEREVDAIRKRTAALQAEADTIEATTFVQERARATAELRAAAAATAAKENRAVTEAEKKSIEELADAYAQAQAQADFLAAVQRQSMRTVELQDELALMGLVGEELYRARNLQEMLNAARQAGITLDEGEMIRMEAIAEQNARYERQIEIMDEIRNTAKDALSTFVQDMRDGVSATEALGNSLDRIADKLIDMALDNLVQAALGGIGGGGGGSILGAFGFANGGVMVPGRGPLKTFARGGISRKAAIFGEAGPEAAVPLPDGRRIPVDLRMGATAAAPSMNVTVAPQFNVQNGSPEGVDRMKGEIVPVVERIVRKEIGQVFDRQRRFTRSGI